MTFAHPVQLYWGLLAIPLVILACVRRAGVRREPVATEMIWEEALAEERVRPAWLRWRRTASLAVQLLVLLLIVLALAEPLNCPPRQIVAVLNNSPGANSSGVPLARLAAVKQAVRALIAGLRECDRMAVVSAGDPPMVYCTMTNEQRVLEAALEAVPPVEGRARPDFALALARRLLCGAPARRIIIVDEGCLAAAAEVAAADEVQMPGPPVWPWLAGSALMLVVFEWCLYQRRWID